MADETQNTPQSIIQEDGAFSEGWLDNVPLPDGIDRDELRNTQAIRDAGSIGNLLHQHANAQKLIGQKTINAIPGEDATDEQRQEFFRNLGVPESPDGYELKAPEDLPEGMNFDQELATEFSTKAHELKLTPQQAQGLSDWFNGKGAEQFQSMNESRQQTLEQAQTALKQEWGNAYDQNLEIANRAVRSLGVQDVLEKNGLDNSPELAKMFHRVAQVMGEDSNINGPQQRGGGNITPGDAQLEINKIMADTKDPYWDDRNPQHADRVRRVQELFAAASP